MTFWAASSLIRAASSQVACVTRRIRKHLTSHPRSFHRLPHVSFYHEPCLEFRALRITTTASLGRRAGFPSGTRHETIPSSMDLLRFESTCRRPSRPYRSVADEPDGELPALYVDDLDWELVE